jgi:hypothetical protein
MRKGYLASWKRREGQEEHITDYLFAPTTQGAATWKTRQDAESDCISVFNRFGIDILSADGGTCLCRNFVVEEIGPGEFVVCCEAPFLVQNALGRSGSETQNKSS